MSKINWAPGIGDTVAEATDYIVRHVMLEFETSLKGQPGFALFYKPAGIRQAEGVDIVVAVAHMWRDQRVLDKVKQNPKILTDDPEVQTLESFFGQAEAPQTRN